MGMIPVFFGRRIIHSAACFFGTAFHLRIADWTMR